MLWFNVKEYGQLREEILLFQYILCCGSTYEDLQEKVIFANFNTSYVVVQLKQG